MPDLDRLPTGQRGWSTLIAALAATDDRSERHYLEMKSQADLTTNVDRAKVAKFILGAANRLPDRAARYFDGHAVMVLGVAHNQLTSVPPVEAHELEQYIAKFTGTPGPSWDYQWVSVDDSRVVVITVDPPRQGDPIWPCMADGHEKLVDGRIYTRDGATRPATGAEIRMLNDRAATVTADAELDVTLVGGVVSAHCDPSLVDTYIDTVRDELLRAHAHTQLHGQLSDFVEISYGLSAVMTEPEDRTFEEYKAEIDTWADKTRKAWPAFISRVLAATAPRTLVRIDNLGDTFLEDVRIDVHIAGDVHGVEAYPPELLQTRRLLPSPPREWGPKPFDMYGQHLVHDFARNFPSVADIAPPGTDGRITFDNSGSVDVMVTLDQLRPRDTANSDADELVLAAPDDSDTFAATWRVTAKGHNTVYEGESTVTVDQEFDLTCEVRALITPNN